MPTLPYTLCFCIQDDQVLMLERIKPPNEGKWNGIGGKIEKKETIVQAVRREVLEEAGIDLNLAQLVRFTGVVTWKGAQYNPETNIGMYVFIAYFPKNSFLWKSKGTLEGTLEWKKMPWVLNTSNQHVVENIPLFLPKMLNHQKPSEYHCTYEDGALVGFEVFPFSKEEFSMGI